MLHNTKINIILYLYISVFGIFIESQHFSNQCASLYKTIIKHIVKRTLFYTPL